MLLPSESNSTCSCSAGVLTQQWRQQWTCYELLQLTRSHTHNFSSIFTTSRFNDVSKWRWGWVRQFPLGFFLHLFQNRTFRDKWHKYLYEPDAILVSQLTMSKHWINSNHWPQPGNIIHESNPILIHCQTPEGADVATQLSDLCLHFTSMSNYWNTNWALNKTDKNVYFHSTLTTVDIRVIFTFLKHTVTQHQYNNTIFTIINITKVIITNII